MVAMPVSSDEVTATYGQLFPFSGLPVLWFNQANRGIQIAQLINENNEINGSNDISGSNDNSGISGNNDINDSNEHFVMLCLTLPFCGI